MDEVFHSGAAKSSTCSAEVQTYELHAHVRACSEQRQSPVKHGSLFSMKAATPSGPRRSMVNRKSASAAP